MGDYRELKVWAAGHRIALAVYRATRAFPAAEMYGLTSQLRRSAASIPANIAEGAGRNTNAEFARYCRIALGSANELDYHLLLAYELEYMSGATYEPLRTDVLQLRRMLAKFHKRLTAP